MVTQVIPVQGPAPGQLNPQMPTLVPNFDKPVSGLSGGGLQSPAQFLAANPRVDATATATIGGSVTTGDILTLAVTNPILKDPAFGPQPNGGTLAKAYTTVGGDTVATIAEKMAALFNDDPNASAFGLRVDVGGAAGAVMTFRQSGPVGNFSVLSAPTEGKGTVTIAGTALTGDSVYVNFSGGNIGAVVPALAQVELLGTTLLAGDNFPVVFTNANIAAFPVTKTYTVVAGDTLATAAAGIVALISADATLSANGLEAVAEGNGFLVQQQGAIGNTTTVSCTPGHGGGGNATIAFTPASGTLAGGSGQVGGVTVATAVTTGQSVTTIAANVTTAINANRDLVALGITATSSVGVVTVTIPAADEPVTMASWVNTALPIITITGSATLADTINAIFTATPAANLPGSPVTATYTVKTADTVTLMAVGLAAAINAIPALSGFGISATNTAGVVNVFGFGGPNGQIRLTTSVTGAATETLTPSAVPTDTAVTGTAATETITLAPSTGVMSGGTGPVFAAQSFSYARGGQVQDFLYGQPYVLDFPYLNALVADGRLVV